MSLMVSQLSISLNMQFGLNNCFRQPHTVYIRASSFNVLPDAQISVVHMLHSHQKIGPLISRADRLALDRFRLIDQATLTLSNTLAAISLTWTD